MFFISLCISITIVLLLSVLLGWYARYSNGWAGMESDGSWATRYLRFIHAIAALYLCCHLPVHCYIERDWTFIATTLMFFVAVYLTFLLLFFSQLIAVGLGNKYFIIINRVSGRRLGTEVIK